MTSIIAATCEAKKAMRFVNIIYPNILEKNIRHLLRLINKDILRVKDPNFQSHLQVIAGNKYNEKYLDQINEAVKELESAIEYC